MADLTRQILELLIRDLFDRPIIGNQYRGDYVERLIVLGLGEGFRLVSEDWAGWDIESKEGVRIEIKQSAARQPWTDQPGLGGRTASGSFDIAPRTGYWSERGSRWVAELGRHADLYVFAWHPVTDASKADHRDPQQWRFFVAPTEELPPNQKTIARSVVEKRWPTVRFEDLREAVTAVIGQLKGRR